MQGPKRQYSNTQFSCSFAGRKLVYQVKSTEDECTAWELEGEWWVGKFVALREAVTWVTASSNQPCRERARGKYRQTIKFFCSLHINSLCSQNNIFLQNTFFLCIFKCQSFLNNHQQACGLAMIIMVLPKISNSFQFQINK